MTELDRKLLGGWVVLTTCAAVAFFFSGFVILLMLTLIGLPVAFLLEAAPALWIYASAALLIYASLRVMLSGWKPAALLAIAVVLVVATGVIVPTIANRATSSKVRLLLAHDFGQPIILPAGASVTYLFDRGLGETDGKCFDVCQRLLLSGVAASYISVPLDLLDRLGDLSAPAFRYSLATPDGRCRNDRMYPSYSSEEEAGPAPGPPYIWDKLAVLGKCLHADAVRDARSDYVMADSYGYDPNDTVFRFGQRKGRYDLSLRPIGPVRRWETFRRERGRLIPIFRRTQVDHALLERPLWLVSPFDFDSHMAAHWAWVGRRTSGFDTRGGRYRQTRWEPWITNNIGVYGLREPDNPARFDKASASP